MLLNARLERFCGGTDRIINCPIYTWACWASSGISQHSLYREEGYLNGAPFLSDLVVPFELQYLATSLIDIADSSFYSVLSAASSPHSSSPTPPQANQTFAFLTP